MAEEVFLLKEQLKEQEEEIAALKYKLAQLETVRKSLSHNLYVFTFVLTSSVDFIVQIAVMLMPFL